MSETRLIDCLATTPELADVFSDRATLQAMLDFESALARAEGRLRIIPVAAAAAISRSAKPENFDMGVLTAAALRAGTPAIPLVKALTEKVRGLNAEAAGYVHWGATSQDVTDTAIVLLLKRARTILEQDLAQLEGSLQRLSNSHAKTVMLGRTLLQPAPPTTFGLRAAGWLGAVRRCRERMAAAFDGALVIQLGGASGTMAALGENGVKIGEAMARELDLAYPDAPWHTHRDRLAALMCACGVMTGALGKMARDISLLMQHEIAEVAEPGGEGRGGSSTMPHKKNPIGCALTIAAALRAPGMVAVYLSAMVQEHERAEGGIQAEWSIVANLVQTAGLAIASMKEVAAGLTVDPKRMRKNIDATQGLVFAERAMMQMAPKMGRESAHKELEKAVSQATAQGKMLLAVLAATPEIASKLDRETLRHLEIPEEYLGAAEEFRKRLLENFEDGDTGESTTRDRLHKNVKKNVKSKKKKG